MPVLSGQRWASSGATTTITWSFGASEIASLGTRYNGYDQFDSYIPTSGVYRGQIQAAFDAWEAVANIDFVQVTDGASVNIRLGDNYIDGTNPGGSSTVGQAMNWASGGIYRASEIYFDSDAYGPSFYQIALHEIGHAIGLDHNSALPTAIMYPSITNANRTSGLTADDIAGVQQIYGSKAAAAATLVTTAWSNILRISANATAESLVSQAGAGAITMNAAIAQIVQLADASTSVATLSYQFFTGRIPTQGGVDYLVAPNGGNGNNINSAYYQFFNLENRYINFAVNLGRDGEGKAGFQSAYGSLSLFDATKKAYGAIFGSAPTEAKAHELIDSRVDYFASYGQDGAAGLGTKAAMVGWLLAEAAKADVGTYAKANSAFLTDLADGAAFAVDLVGVYGRPDYAYAG